MCSLARLNVAEGVSGATPGTNGSVLQQKPETIFDSFLAKKYQIKEIYNCNHGVGHYDSSLSESR